MTRAAVRGRMGSFGNSRPPPWVGRNLDVADCDFKIDRELDQSEYLAMMKLALPLPAEGLRAFCKKWKIARLEVFGSILRDDFGPQSDIDFLATWEPDAAWTVFDHVRMERELATLLGRGVDLVSRRAVEEGSNWIRRRNILESAEVVHEAGR